MARGGKSVNATIELSAAAAIHDSDRVNSLRRSMAFNPNAMRLVLI
jgi:hypothetical protein